MQPVPTLAALACSVLVVIVFSGTHFIVYDELPQCSLEVYNALLYVPQRSVHLCQRAAVTAATAAAAAMAAVVLVDAAAAADLDNNVIQFNEQHCHLTNAASSVKRCIC
jgi:hypothetical protein